MNRLPALRSIFDPLAPPVPARAPAAPPAPAQDDPKGFAEAALRAYRRARGETDPPPAPGTFAAQVLAAVAKARGR